jgi:hypothetical protein
MHRMRCLTAQVGLALGFSLLLGLPVSAELIHPPGGRAYPDLAGALTGSQDYLYNRATQTGAFQATSTPFLLATGPAATDESVIQPNADGVRSQVVSLTLDSSGRLVSDPGNTFELYGTVVLGGQTFRGLLLQAIPTAFGARGGASPAFNLDMRVTGGALAQTFGPDLYMELHTSLGSAFDGSFAESFSTTIDTTRTLGFHAPAAKQVPEPSTLVVLLACGAGLIFRRQFRRLRVTLLERPGRAELSKVAR